MDLLCLPTAVLQPSGELGQLTDMLWSRCIAAGFSTAALRSSRAVAETCCWYPCPAGMPTLEALQLASDVQRGLTGPLTTLTHSAPRADHQATAVPSPCACCSERGLVEMKE